MPVKKLSSQTTIRLDKEQSLAVVANLTQPIAVLAGPGSGKTTVITQRYKWMLQQGIDPQHILAVTFSKDMAAEMKKRIKSVAPQVEQKQVSTIHAFCYRFLRSFGDTRLPAEEWLVKKTLQDACDRVRWRTNWRAVRWWIEKSKIDGVPTNKEALEAYLDGRVTKNEAYKIMFAYSSLKEMLEKHNKITFPDMINDTWQMLQEDRYLEHAQAKYKHVLVDESQDTFPMGVAILERIVPHNIFVVGDPDQTLYRFAGADPEHNLFRYSNIVKLQTNYRSDTRLVRAANRLIRHNYSEDRASFLKKMRPASTEKGHVTIKAFDNVEAEADWIATKLQTEVQPGQAFIGARTNAQLAYVERALYKRDIPYIVLGSVSFFNKPHIRAVVDYIRLAHNPHCNDAFVKVYNIASNNMVDTRGCYIPHRWLGQRFLQDCETKSAFYLEACTKMTSIPKYKAGVNDLLLFVADVRRTLARGSTVAVDYVVKNCYIKHFLHSQEDMAIDPSEENSVLQDLSVVSDIARDYPNIPDFLKFVAEMQKQRKTSKKIQSSAILSTIHKLKGLERQVVFGIGWSEGLLPHSNTIWPAQVVTNALKIDSVSDIKDERCIAYVCFTRAKHKVYLSYVKNWQGKFLMPSRFLFELFPTLKEQLSVTPPAPVAEYIERELLADDELVTEHR